MHEDGIEILYEITRNFPVGAGSPQGSLSAQAPHLQPAPTVCWCLKILIQAARVQDAFGVEGLFQALLQFEQERG